MKHPKLTAEPRSILGKKVKKLRREGFLPANVYGKELASVAVQVTYPEFSTVYKEVGETGLVDLMVDGERRPVLIKNIHWNHRSNTPLHADFYQVNLKEKVKSMVPLEFIGEAKAEADKVGLLLTTLNEVEVEALPEELPEKIEVNVEPLAELDAQLTVEDLPVPQGVTILTDPGQVVARIGELAVAEPEPTEEVAEPELIGKEGEEVAEDEASETQEEAREEKEEK